MLRHALNYLSLGFSVIPLEPRGKKPLISWAEFQKRRASEKEVREWFKKWPDANLGIVTGNISTVAVVDLDGPEGIAFACRLNLSSNITSLTGEGKHLWYHMESVISNAVKLYPGIDIRGEGGYVVAPPSVHENGLRYRWTHPLRNLDQLTTFPGLLLNPKPDIGLITSESHSEGWIANALEGMKDGNIDNTIVSILGRLRFDGYSQADARAFLSPYMERVKAESGHLEEKIKNIWSRYEAKPMYDQKRLRGASDSGLVIHSPSNPDSIKQFEQSRSALDESGFERLGTGYPKLDTMLQSGLKSSRLFTVAARTGVGKTNWLIGVAKHLCEEGKKVLLFSTEMPYTEIWARYVATLKDTEEFSKHQFFVCDSFAPSVEKVEEIINEIKPDLFIFDHINHVSEEQRELGAFMQGLNYLRRKYECAGIVSAQLNRSADWIDLKSGEKVTPRMSMIKGSGTIEQASSRVLLLSETRVTPEGTEIVGNLDKNDNGDKGMIHFRLTRNPYRMVEL